MNIKERLERLEHEYFGEKHKGHYLSELEFSIAFDKKYDGCEDSAPEVLRRAYARLSRRRCQTGEEPKANDS